MTKVKINMQGWKLSEHGVPDSFYSIPEDAEPIKQGNKIYWPAICKCGTQKLVEGTKLRSGHTKSCGCKKKFATVDLTNQTFTYLTALYPLSERRYGNVVWHCQCKCGNYTDATVASLKNGTVRSCGCLQKINAAKRAYHLENQIFNEVLVLERDYEYPIINHIKDEHSYWKCKCLRCGNIFTAVGRDLITGHTASCGCLRFQGSKGEDNIRKILDDNNIKYIYNKEYFKDLILEKGKPGRYDFIILNNNNQPQRIIEFDGLQHNKSNTLFGENEFLRLQRADKIKNEYALSHNIPLVRIPYKERDHITLEMIMGDKYLIKSSNG